LKKETHKFLGRITAALVFVLLGTGIYETFYLKQGFTEQSESLMISGFVVLVICLIFLYKAYPEVFRELKQEPSPYPIIIGGP